MISKFHWTTSLFFDKKVVKSDLNMFHGNMSDFVSFPLFEFRLVIELRNFDFKSQWNILIFSIKNYNALDLNRSHGRMSHFVSFPLLGFTLVIKLINDFESWWYTLIFVIKGIWGQIWMYLSCVWFGSSLVVWAQFWI